MENQFNKITTISDVLSLFKDEMTIMVGGFGGVGSPPSLLSALLQTGVRDLTLICNDTGFPSIGVGPLICEKRVSRVIASHIGSNPVAGEYYSNGELQVEFSPQGTFIERVRAAGVGLGGILVDTGIGQEVVNKGKTQVEINGQSYLLETPLKAEVSLIYAKRADPFGNLVFDKSARNTNPLMAMAGDFVIVEAEEIVPLGSLDPEEIVTPGVFVDRIVASEGVKWKWAWE